VNALRGIWADLVEKRLWPVAVALALALVALPALALKPAPAVQPPAPVADTAGPAHLVTDPAAIASSRPGGPVLGEVKNPFEQKHVPKKASSAPTTGGAGAAAGATAAPAGGDATPSPSGGDTPSRPKTKPAADDAKRLKIRFGPSGGKRKVLTLTPSKPLPSSTDPMLVFVKVGSGSQAEFLVSSDAVPEGDGRCKPSKKVCAQLFVKAGDTEFFDVARDGDTVQYQLDVLDVIG
jgi:hypothetical protein